MRSLWVVAVALVLACGGSEKKREAPAGLNAAGDEEEDPRQDSASVVDASDDGMEVEGLKGRLDPADIQAGVEPHSEKLAGCFESKSKKKKYLGGRLELGFVVGRQGEVKSVAVSQGDLGSWEVESCLLEVARAMSFPVPEGSGDADFVIPLDFPARRQSLWWSEERGEEETAEARGSLDACEPEPSNVWVTLYIGPGGKVLSSGFASKSGAISPEWAVCATESMSAWTVADPRGKIAKLGFLYNPE